MKLTGQPQPPFGLSLPKSCLLLLTLYLVVVTDTVTGLNLNLFGYGREPLMFAFGTVVVASLFYVRGRFWLGMIALVLCCAWLLLYPAKNGFDVVLSPLVTITIMMWLWSKRKPKQ